MALHWFDLLVVLVIGISAVMSLLRGFVREFVSLATWVAAVAVVLLFTPTLALVLEPWIATDGARRIAAGFSLGLSTLIVGSLIGIVLKRLTHASGLSVSDRLLGMVFGCVRGAVLTVAGVAVLTVVGVTHSQDAWKESRLLPHFFVVAEWSKSLAGGFWPDAVPTQAPDSVPEAGPSYDTGALRLIEEASAIES